MSSTQLFKISGMVMTNPEIRHFPNGGQITKFSMVYNEKWKDKTSGEPKEKTQWFNIQCSNKTGELAATLITKGRIVDVMGKIWQNEYMDKNNIKTKSMHVECREFRLLDKRPEGQAAIAPKQESTEGITAYSQMRTELSDDDIPF